MKKIRIFFLFSLIILLTVGLFSCRFSPNDLSAEDYFRIHVRANSNADCDQRVKYAVRDLTVDYLAPIVQNAESAIEAATTVEKYLPKLEQAANEKLRAEGFSYGASARIQKETFPTRVYEGQTLEAGEYLALIITLGKGEGENWWCVVYPPLCFSSAAGEITYKSKLAELISKWAGND